MKNEEFHDIDDIICPYCKKVLATYQEEGYSNCEHLIFVASSYGFDFIREDMKNIIDENTEQGLDEYTSQLPIDGIKYAQRASGIAVGDIYWGFLIKE